MREFFKTRKEHAILYLGIALFAYSLFNFDSGRHCDRGSLPPLFDECTNPATFYYYNKLTLSLLVIGVIFIVSGILKARKKKSEN